MTNDGDKAAKGLTLFEAIERYSDPADWQAYKEAAARVPKRAPPIRSNFVSAGREGSAHGSMGMDHATYLRLKHDRNRLWRKLVTAFVEKLCVGPLRTTGFALPLQPDSRRIPMASDLWEVLRPDFRSRNSIQKSIARGGGLAFEQIRVFPGETPAESGDTAWTEIEVAPPRKGGRPSHRKEVEAEMRRRWKASEIEPSLNAECRRLAAWINNKHRKHVYAWETLRKSLRPLYRELRGRKKPD